MRVLLIGLDAFDPRTFERLYDQGLLPNLGRYVKRGGYRRFAVSNPPQSEVSWTSIATGLNPGGHGLFDFVHRDPKSYALNVSLLPTKQGFGGTHFAPPFNARTVFDKVVQQGYPATALWWPAMFPARPGSPVRTIPGLGTPDILGRLGVGTLFSADRALIQNKERKTAVSMLHSKNGRYLGKIHGPMRKRKGKAEAATLDLQLEAIEDDVARLRAGKQVLELQTGKWSPVVALKFRVGFFFSIHALTKFILTKGFPEPQLYSLPLQIHPLHSPWRYATPRGFVKQAWKSCGPFLTLGWPQDTTALEENCISDEQFLDLCASIFTARECVLMDQIDQFSEGILACVFDTLDRVQHMFWKDRPDIIEEWYVKLDSLIGRVEKRLDERGLSKNTRLVIVSDHGFARFDHKANLNHWLVDHGYLVPLTKAKEGDLNQVDWEKSQAYAIGLNSIYLNVAGREGKGTVEHRDIESVLTKLKQDLAKWHGPDERPVVQKTYPQSEAFDGPLTSYGPDLVVGFSPGYRASQSTGLGAWSSSSLEANTDHWGADHCIDPEAVPGVLFSNADLNNYSSVSYRDIPAITIGAEPDSGGSTPPPTPMSSEDEKIIEERLKSLGYL